MSIFFLLFSNDKIIFLWYLNLKRKGLDSFPSVESVFKSHLCAPSCIASRNHSIKKLETHIADRIFFYCLQYLVCYHKKENDWKPKKELFPSPFDSMKKIFFLTFLSTYNIFIMFRFCPEATGKHWGEPDQGKKIYNTYFFSILFHYFFLLISIFSWFVKKNLYSSTFLIFITSKIRFKIPKYFSAYRRQRPLYRPCSNSWPCSPTRTIIQRRGINGI